MRKMFSLVCICFFLLAFVTTTVDVFAQEDAPDAPPAGTQVNAPVTSGIDGKSLVKAFALLGAGIAMGFGAIGPGIGEGFAAGKACEGMAKRPDQSGLLTRSMLIGQAVSESTGIYSLVIALILIYS